MDAVRIVAIGGSLRRRSKSRAALGFGIRAAERAGAKVTLVDVRQAALPLFNPEDRAGHGQAQVKEFIEAIRAADGLMWVAPAYHGAVSGSFKNVIDYLDLLATDKRAFLAGRVVGVVSVGAGTLAAVHALGQMTQIAHALRAVVCPLAVAIGCSEKKFSEEGGCTDTATLQQLSALGAQLVEMARRLRSVHR